MSAGCFPIAQTAMWRHIESLFAAENVPLPASYVTTNSVLALRALIMRTDSVTISSPNLMKLELASGRLAADFVTQAAFHARDRYAHAP